MLFCSFFFALLALLRAFSSCIVLHGVAEKRHGFCVQTIIQQINVVCLGAYDVVVQNVNRFFRIALFDHIHHLLMFPVGLGLIGMFQIGQNPHPDKLGAETVVEPVNPGVLRKLDDPVVEHLIILELLFDIAFLIDFLHTLIDPMKIFQFLGAYALLDDQIEGGQLQTAACVK